MTQRGSPAASGGHRLTELEPATRRRLIRASAARGLLTSGAVVAVYFLIPFTSETGRAFVVRTTVGVVAVALVTIVQLRSILRADYPELRTAEGFALAVPLLLTVFGGAYLVLSTSQVGAFSEELDHVGALYLSLMTATTVGFGDVAPLTELARAVVMLQMIADVVLLGFAVRVAYAAIRTNLEDRPTSDGSRPGAP